MSPWWREPVAVRLGGGAAASSFDAEPDGPSESELAAFAARLDGLALAPATLVRCWLGSGVVRSLVVPWHDGLAHAGQRMPFAEHCFREVYGATAERWTVRVSPAARGRPALACAVDTRLRERVEAIVRDRGLKLAGLRPVLMEAYNRARAHMRRTPSAWFVLVEPPWISLLLVRDGGCTTIKRLAGAESDLARLLERERLCQGIESERLPVWLVRSGPPPGADPQHGDLPCVTLAPLLDAADTALRGAAAGVPA